MKVLDLSGGETQIVIKTLLQITVCCLLFMVVGCTSEKNPEVERTNTPTAVPTSTTVPTPTEEPMPTVEATPFAEIEVEAERAETESVAAINITKPLPVGDPQRGEVLLEVKACAGCHYLGRVGPAPSWKAEIYAGGKGIATRATERWQKAGYSGEATSETEYLVESILMPNAYVIEGYMQGTMPQTFGELLTEQELADIISYLLEIE